MRLYECERGKEGEIQSIVCVGKGRRRDPVRLYECERGKEEEPWEIVWLFGVCYVASKKKQSMNLRSLQWSHTESNYLYICLK